MLTKEFIESVEKLDLQPKYATDLASYFFHQNYLESNN